MQVSNNNQKNSQILRLWFLKLNYSLNQKNKMQKLELQTLMISKALLTQNGKLFMKNFKKFMMLEPILYFQNYLLET
jgi:hypothetical protein